MSGWEGLGQEARLKVGAGRGFRAPASAPRPLSQGEGRLSGWPLGGKRLPGSRTPGIPGAARTSARGSGARAGSGGRGGVAL